MELNLYELRKNLHLTQLEVATLIYVSRPTYASWEKNSDNIPLCKLKLICKVFNIQADVFFKSFICFDKDIVHNNVDFEIYSQLADIKNELYRLNQSIPQ